MLLVYDCSGFWGRLPRPWAISDEVETCQAISNFILDPKGAELYAQEQQAEKQERQQLKEDYEASKIAQRQAVLESNLAKIQNLSSPPAPSSCR